MLLHVMPGLVPGIHVLLSLEGKTWMAGTSPGHDKKAPPALSVRSRFGLTLPVFLPRFRSRDSPLDKIYFH
jgi:hypothetical protein